MSKFTVVLEQVFERILWNSRFFVLLAVIFSLLSSIVLFIIGSLEIVAAIKETILLYPGGHWEHKDLLSSIIGGIDLYLISVVFLLFSFGIYELFISKIDIGRDNKEIKILEIASLDELKSKILKVVIMVLIVSFFQRVLTMEYRTPLEMLYFALSICVLTLGIFLLNKSGHS